MPTLKLSGGGNLMKLSSGALLADCGCLYRRARLCDGGTETDYYALATEIDVSKAYEIGEVEGCVFFSGCYEGIPEGGEEAVILTEFANCDECEDPAPCACPEDLDLAYQIDFDVAFDDGVDTDTCHVSRTVTEVEACSWSIVSGGGYGGSPPDVLDPCLPDIGLTLVTTPPCKWRITSVDAVFTAEKTGGNTPMGAYTIVGGVEANFTFSNIVVS